MTVTPCTIKAAQRWIALHHRHLPRVNGGRFAVAVSDETGVRGVGIVGNGPRVWEGSTKMVITRVATDGVKNGCSMLYGALCRAGAALGYTEAWTYTLPNEPGDKSEGLHDSTARASLRCAHSQNSDGCANYDGRRNHPESQANLCARHAHRAACSGADWGGGAIRGHRGHSASPYSYAVAEKAKTQK